MKTILRVPLLAAALILSLAAWSAHPIHAARVEIEASATGAITGVVHVYRDDFPPGTDLPAITAYLDRTLVITDRRGARVVLRATAVVPEGDRLRIDLAGRTNDGIGRGRIALSVLQERYPDQVNVVDARIEGRRAQLVFLRGDAAQALP